MDEPRVEINSRLSTLARTQTDLANRIDQIQERLEAQIEAMQVNLACLIAETTEHLETRIEETRVTLRVG